MATQKHCSVIQVTQLAWPSTIALSCRRFRLFVAADTTVLSVNVMSDFASAALSRGMVYFSTWGRGCERFHDIVDEVANDEFGKGRLVGSTPGDVVMTTWHEDESLEEALEFFATSAVPTDGFAYDSDHQLVICVGNPLWAQVAERFFQSASNDFQPRAN